MSNELDDSSKQEELVITPGGPRPKDRVHLVGPGEAVIVDESGNARIVPREQTGGTLNMAEDMVLTPGGFRPKSRVHLIEPGHVLDGSGGRLRKLNLSGQVVADFGLIPTRPSNEPLMPGSVAVPPKEVPALGSGWITYAYWNNNTGTPISSFTTTWIVPPAPKTQSNQQIYLFNGIQNSEFSFIYQPVLQWGPSPAGGGNSWAVASWYVDGQGGPAFSSQLTPVNPGDTLVGGMALLGQLGSLFSYNCQFQGFANSSLLIQNVQELTWCSETLEAYRITQCSDYPDAVTAFTQISIQTGNSYPTLNWNPVNWVTDCGQQTVVVNNSNPGGEVDIHFKPPSISLDAANITLDGHSREVSISTVEGSAFSPNGKVDFTLSTAGGRVLATGQETANSVGQAEWVYSPNRRVFSCGEPLTASAYDLASGAPSNVASAKVACDS